MENRTRKLAPQYHRQEWRSKPAGNSATHRYPREYILKHYQNLIEPHIGCRGEIEEIVLAEPSPPLLTAVFPFAHALGDEPNSRKFPPREKRTEQMPEWYEDEEPKETMSKPMQKVDSVEKVQAKTEHQSEVKLIFTSNDVKNLPEINETDLEEKFTKVDLEVEEKLKKIENEDDYGAPDWDDPTKEEFTFEPIKPVRPAAPVYEINLLRYHFAIGNPFAQTLMDFGVPMGKTSVTYALDSKPFEKIWYYKDLESHVHGPFSTLEMFGWTIRNCFPPDLEIAIGNSMYFVPMNIFNSVPQIPDPAFYDNPKKKSDKEAKTLEEIESQQRNLVGKFTTTKTENHKNTKPNESATLELKNILGLNTKNK